jgi:3-oxoacyl-[acyl-carrier-protein] synthase II
MAAAVAPPLCTWLVAACLSAACGDGEKENERRHRGGGVGGFFGSRRRLGSGRRGVGRSGQPISRFLLPKSGFFHASL